MKEMAVASRYGVGRTVDIFLLVFSLVAWIPALWTSVLTYVLIPLSARLSRAQRNAFHSELTGFSLIAGGFLTVLASVALPSALTSFDIGFSPETTSQGAGIGCLLSVLCGLGLLIGTASVRLQAMERHANTLLEAVPALCLLVIVLAWPDLQRTKEITPLVIGTIVGSVIQFCGLSILLSRSGERLKPSFSFRSPAWKVLWQGLTVMLLGNFILSFVGPIDQVMAAPLGEGSIATLGYANRVLSLILGLGATAIARSLLPVLSEFVAAGKRNSARHYAMRWATFLMALGLLMLACGSLLAHFGIEMLFERGAFTAEDTDHVAQVLRLGLLQVPFYFSGIVLVQLLASLGHHRTIAINAVVILLLKVAANFVLGSWLGISGLALATGVMYAGSMTILGFAAWHLR